MTREFLIVLFVLFECTIHLTDSSEDIKIIESFEPAESDEILIREEVIGHAAIFETMCVEPEESDDISILLESVRHSAIFATMRLFVAKDL